MSLFDNAGSDREDTLQSSGVFVLRDPADYERWSDRMTDAMMGKRLYSFIDDTELPPVRPKYTSRPLTIQQMRDYDQSENADEKYEGKTRKQLKEMFEAIKYEYDEYEKKDKRYNETMYFIKKNLSEENRQTVASLRDPREIWNTIRESNITSGLAQFMKLLDELKAVKGETPRTPQNLAKLYAKLNELAKKLDSGGLLTPDSLALHFFIRSCGNQFKQTFESMQEEYRDKPQQCPKLAQVWQRVTRAVHMSESHPQEARPTVRGRAAATTATAASTTATTTESASLNALSGSTKSSRKRQLQDNSNEEPPAKRKSRRKRETEEDWAEFPVCKNCKMRHPKEDDNVCWYLHPEQAKSWFNKTRAAERLKEFRKNSNSNS
jgi:hypothetical protein